MDDKIYLGCLGIEAIFTAIQPYQLFQWISLIITIISAIVGLVFKIVSWYRKAKADGKIDIKEVEEGVKIVQEGIEDVKDAAEKGQENLKEKSDD